jgi:MoaA/NifB/PqqE/SkfB family radical SAM enzyme
MFLEQPTKLQFELSSMCNALCLGCVRTDSYNFNEKKSIIPDKQYIELDTLKNIIQDPEFKSVEELEFCGTIDDPLMHPEFLEFLDWASTVGDYRILIHTNASLRNAAYWTRLAEVLLKHKQHIVKFSIDGLEDTNHIYRQNTTWSKIMENAEAFIKAGGVAGWQYLIFPWNEHQIMQAKEISVKMGFFEFMSRHDRSIATSHGLEKIMFDKTKTKPKKPNYTSNDEINEQLKNTVNNEIRCNSQTKKMYFIGYDGRLWPCCFLHNGRITLDEGKLDILNKRLFEAYGDYDWNNCNKHSVTEILQHPFYKNDLVSSWKSTNHSTGTTDRIHRCTEVCNVKTLEVLPIGNYKLI